MWQWSNYLHSLAGACGSGVLHVNLDETHIQVRPPALRGNACSVALRLHRRRKRPQRNASTAEQRLGFTLVALICDDPAVQPLVPQLLICGLQALTAAQYQAMLAECPPTFTSCGPRKVGIPARSLPGMCASWHVP